MTDEIRAAVHAVLADPMSLPPELWTYSMNRLAVDGLPIPLRQITGFPQSSPAYRFTRVEFTSPLTISVTTEATASTVVTAAAVTFDGTTEVDIEFGCPYVQPASAANAGVHLILYDGSSSVGFLGTVGSPAANNLLLPVRASRTLTPSAASHTYSVRAYQAGGNGTVGAGAGGSGNYMPGYIKITKV